MTRDQLIENIQRYGLKASEAMDVVRLVDKYIEANTTEYHAKGALALAQLGERMREAQKRHYANRDHLQDKFDDAITRIKTLNEL